MIPALCKKLSICLSPGLSSLVSLVIYTELNHLHPFTTTLDSILVLAIIITSILLVLYDLTL